jgi:NAD+ kinase
MNEFNVHMGRINSAVRYRLWINDEPFHGGHEIIGDGLVISTPFGSTAYFNHITRGVFHLGIGIAFKAPVEQTSHIIVPEQAQFRVAFTRGPAVLAFDNSPDYFDLGKDDELIVRKSDQPATILTWQVMTHPSDEF